VLNYLGTPERPVETVEDLTAWAVAAPARLC